MKTEMQVGYCGNVHPGKTLREVKQNLSKYASQVKKQVRPESLMGIGLWLSATAAQELRDEVEIVRFRDWLMERGLLPFTFNGFPFGDFHQEVVKHNVYHPTWAETSRLDYTVRLAEIQNLLLPDGLPATISTLPLGWHSESDQNEDSTFVERCAANLRRCARALADLEEKSGRNVKVCIEPEPGCLLDTCEDVVSFFDQRLLTGDPVEDQMILRHIGICHDICHSAVMYEDQAAAIDAYCRAGLSVGKIQVSSAIEVDFDRLSRAQVPIVLGQLASFAEPRYLHQTSIRSGTKIDFFEDLPLALTAAKDRPSGLWRVHFHVPIFASNLGLMGTTQSGISDCISAIQKSGCDVGHIEIETYAWNVLPQHMKSAGLAADIATEMEWLDQLLAKQRYGTAA